MCSNIREDVFDDLLSVAFNKYLEEELSKMPSDEELAEMYPIPVKQIRKVQRYARRLRYRNSKPTVFLKRVAVACLIISIFFSRGKNPLLSMLIPTATTTSSNMVSALFRILRWPAVNGSKDPGNNAFLFIITMPSQ